MGGTAQAARGRLRRDQKRSADKCSGDHWRRFLPAFHGLVGALARRGL